MMAPAMAVRFTVTDGPNSQVDVGETVTVGTLESTRDALRPSISGHRRLISSLKLLGDEAALDIRCGDGKVTAELSSLVPKGRGVGLDSSQEMVDFAMMSFPSSEHPNLSFRFGDAKDTDFSEEFDLAVSFACFHWVEDHRTVLKGIRKSLKPFGRKLIQCGGKGNAADIMSAASDLVHQDWWTGYFQGFNAPYLILAKIGPSS